MAKTCKVPLPALKDMNFGGFLFGGSNQLAAAGGGAAFQMVIPPGGVGGNQNGDNGNNDKDGSGNVIWRPRDRPE